LTPGSSGPSGSAQETPSIHATSTTRTLKEGTFGPEADPALRRLWSDVTLTSEDGPTFLDLGNRQVTFEPRRGHTLSDLTVKVAEENVIWCGDLVWNGMFPNYMDAIPSRLSRAVRALAAGGPKLFVPGHGPLADARDLGRYMAVIDGVEETARSARREGWTAQEAAERHSIPPDLGEWTLFNPSYFQRAVEAWMREWSG
jgi:glyoxylase-like metal-dependent hydrolase (beta-lactamase superfamily II)